MAQDETTILAQLSNTRAAIDRVIAGIASVGDYTSGGLRFNRADPLTALTKREERLVAQLGDLSYDEISTSDVEDVSQLGESSIEFEED